ncbi:MAG: hypothetical protein DME98_17925 [Verrucomicrobia bacterium]|nr:MAG: hypothetical protein DME98_17925 [Verrucomicrobiota bacterium]
MTKLGHWTDRLLRKPAQTFRNEENMERYGIRNIMRAAKLYNRWRYHDRAKRHDNAYKTHLDQLLIENAGPGFGQHRKIELNDGWALDTSQSLPGLDRLLDEAGQVARERAGRIHSDIQRPYFRSLIFPDDIKKYPSWLDFITSSEILEAVTHYLKTIPVLSKTRPPGVRFMESNQNLDPNPPARMSPVNADRGLFFQHQFRHGLPKRLAIKNADVLTGSPTRKCTVSSTRKRRSCSLIRRARCFSSTRAAVSITAAGDRISRVCR